MAILLQHIVVLTIVALAAAWLGREGWRKIVPQPGKGSCGCGTGGCAKMAEALKNLPPVRR